MNLVQASGVDIAYERAGDGPPLVFVHGGAEDGRVWQPQLVVIPGAGHVTNLERPEQFNAAVREFCRAHVRT